MTLTFVTNFVHHHQLPLADEFFRILGNDYRYVATKALPDWLIKGGYDPTLDRSYIIRPYRSDEEMFKARQLIDSSDIVIQGASPLEWTIQRKKNEKVTFHFTERIYKKGVPWIKLPWHAYLNYRNFGQYKNTYLLCASAFTANDFALTRCFVGKSFKWGYFTKVDESYDVEVPNQGDSNSEITQIMWCARFIKLKHPELPVLLASRLKGRGYKFHLNMFGSGEEFEYIKALISSLSVEDCVTLRGNLPNEEILKEMRRHSVFLFTSDQNEGWGAVLNECMANGCVPVASDVIGSVPYLIKDRVNGMVFHSGNLDSLFEKTILLLDNPTRIKLMSLKASSTMRDVWSPMSASKNFLELSQYVLEGKLSQYNKTEGPASWHRI